MEVILPSTLQPYTTASYELVQCRPKIFKFHSVKSAIRRELIRLQREKKKKEKIAKRREEIDRLIAENPGIEINEETFLSYILVLLSFSNKILNSTRFEIFGRYCKI